MKTTEEQQEAKRKEQAKKLAKYEAGTKMLFKKVSSPIIVRKVKIVFIKIIE